MAESKLPPATRAKTKISKTAPPKAAKAPVSQAPKAKTPKAASKPRTPKKAAPAIGEATVKPTLEEIALRAYFIAENRHRLGLPGGERQDWLQAEAELSLAAQKKRARR